jgi:hypothetical protein
MRILYKLSLVLVLLSSAAVVACEVDSTQAKGGSHRAGASHHSVHFEAPILVNDPVFGVIDLRKSSFCTPLGSNWSSTYTFSELVELAYIRRMSPETIDGYSSRAYIVMWTKTWMGEQQCNISSGKISNGLSMAVKAEMAARK